jgi:nucleotide-binding universal stress UspA family protein
MTDQQTTGLIIVGVDGSDESEAALEWAVEDARRRNARVRVVTGFDFPWTSIIVPTFNEVDYEREAQALLDRTLETFRASHPDVELDSLLVPGRPAVALVEAARHADLLVVGGHGHGRLQGMHLGSVATYCVHHAPCPVVVHRVHE